MKISLFCGGRGSSALIRELLTWPQVELSLLVNAYDDGLSTGEIRDLFPGLLGPSDFRKNIVSAMAIFEPNQYYLQSIFEHRLGFSDNIMMKNASLNDPKFLVSSDKKLDSLFAALQSQTRKKLFDLVAEFIRADEVAESSLLLNDAAFGNVIFAGAYLKHKKSFSGALNELAQIFEVDAKIVNVSDTNAFLFAELDDGSLLLDEASIVSYSGSRKIIDVHFSPVKQSKAVGDLGVDKRWVPALNPEVLDALRQSDIVILGSGTQHSSLFPSYKILKGHIDLSSIRAHVVMVSNLDEDADIRGWSVQEIVAQAESYLGSRAINTVIVDSECSLPYEPESSSLRKRLLVRSLRNPRKPESHSGVLLHRAIRESLQGNVDQNPYNQVSIFLSSQSKFTGNSVKPLEELDDLPVVTKVNYATSPNSGSNSPSLDAIREWLEDEAGLEYFVVVDGPGRYEISDAVEALRWLAPRGFGLAIGSRTQSRLAWRRDVARKYMGSSVLRSAGIFGGILASLLIAMKLKVILSDPLSRCFVFSRSGLGEDIRNSIMKCPSLESAITRIILGDVQTLEFPVRYRSMTGFRSENPLTTGLRGLLRLLKAQ
jgi:2-phospho-L-lactate transferase/gluconeogenesis factor (CofD/UPF0052 family)